MNQIRDGTQKKEVKAIKEMPIKVKPYQHQIKAFNFALKIIGEGGNASAEQ